MCDEEQQRVERIASRYRMNAAEDMMSKARTEAIAARAESDHQLKLHNLWPIEVFKPKLSADGDQWCFLLGADLQEGIAGFGDTVEEAAHAFSRAVMSARAGVRKAGE
jgi:hypothetical protein